MTVVQPQLSCQTPPEATTSVLQRDALKQVRVADAALIGLVSGRPARGIMNRLMEDIEPLFLDASAFATAGGVPAPLKSIAQAHEVNDSPRFGSAKASACVGKCHRAISYALSRST